MKASFVFTFGLCFGLSFSAEAHDDAEAFEASARRVSDLPRGKEADGIIGDFVLRNDRVEAVISQNSPLRRANMSTFYGESGITPGCLYDFALRGSNNDQITIFAPSGQQGPVSYVRILNPGGNGRAAVETVVTAARNDGLFKRHEYRLEDHWQGVLILTELRNESDAPKKIATADRWTTLNDAGKVRGVTMGNAIDPADRAGYAYAWVEADGLKAPPAELTLRPGEERVYARFLAVGRSPAEALGIVLARQGPAGVLSGFVRGAAGEPAVHAEIRIGMDGQPVVAYPNDEGFFRVLLPPGRYEVEIADLGRDPVRRAIDVAAGAESSLDAGLPEQSAVDFDITDESGRSIPCKVQFAGIRGTPSPRLGPQNRARGCVDQYHSEKGQFRVQLPPGDYRVVVTRGPEFNHLETEVLVPKAGSAQMKGALRRLVQTPGWVSADFHSHSTPSGDNTCGTDDRMINLAAEHIEFAPTTEHNRLYDWQPHIERLGLRPFIYTIPGIELTGSGAHFNAFPFEPVPFTQDGGAPVWNKDPRLNAIVLREYQGFRADRWIQINHPDLIENFFDRHADGEWDGGFLGLGTMIDGIETQNGNWAGILEGAPYRIVLDRTGKETVSVVREFVWLQMLNQGIQVWGQAVSDAHSVFGNGVGGWRSYVASPTDDPASLDWQHLSRSARAGRMILTSGPFLEVVTGDGVPAGGLARATGGIDLHVRVQCTDWIDIDRVQVLVNGVPRADLNFTRASHPDWFSDDVVKFDQVIRVRLRQDSHIIVVAFGENFDLSKGFGSSPQARLRPCAYNNPIFVDADGGGFQPNGDSLGFPLPAKKISVDEAKALLASRAKSSL